MTREEIIKQMNELSEKMENLDNELRELEEKYGLDLLEMVSKSYIKNRKSVIRKENKK